MSEELEPFICDGLSLGIPNQDETSISKLDNVLFLDENGELHFRDEYIRNSVNILGESVDTITLQQLTSRMKGVYLAHGRLYFYDESVSRPYSLHEIIGAYTNWKNKIKNGGVFWLGRTQIDSSECNNIKVDVNGDPTFAVNTTDGRYFIKNVDGEYSQNSNGTKVFSIDQYLLESIDNGDFSSGDYKTTATDEWRWHDVPNLEIIIPPITEDVSSHIVAKVSVRMIKTLTPVVFRLFDETSGVELDRVSIANGSTDTVEQQVTLTYVGPLDQKSYELEQIDCQCPTELQEDIITNEPAHTIKVQFYVNDILQDDVIVTSYSAVTSAGDCDLVATDMVKYVGVERRIIGIPNSLTETPITNSTIDVILYNTSKKDSYGRKSGNISVVNKDIITVTFENSFTDANYSVSLSCNKNINTWYTNKTPSGFTIRAEKKFTGDIDWVAMKLISEGE